jgi:hypothetical protein
MNQVSTVEPPEIKLVAVMRYELVGLGSDFRELGDHLAVVAVVPRQRVDSLTVLPLPADANDRPLLDDVLVINENLPATPPREHNVW